VGIEENKNLVRLYWDALNAGDFEQAFAMLADDIVFVIGGSTRLSGAYHGKEELQSKLLIPLLELIEPDLTMSVKELIAEGDRVVCLAEGTWRTRTGKPYQNTAAVIYRIKDGKISESVEYIDTAQFETTVLGRTLV
jgi:hypothetical protein